MTNTGHTQDATSTTAGQATRLMWVALVLWCAALAILQTWPVAFRLGDQVLGSPQADGLKHLWTLWRIRHDVWTEHRFPLHTDLLNFPEGLDLYPIEPLNGLIVCLLPLSIVAATNVATLLNLAMMGISAGILARAIVNSRWAIFAAATLFQTSSVALFTIHVGVGELQHLWWVPLGLAAWARVRWSEDGQVGSWRQAVVLGLALAGAVWSCFYHGFFLAMSVSVLSLITLWAGRATLRLLFRYGLAAGLALALVWPPLRAFSTSYNDDSAPRVGLGEYVMRDHGQPLTDPPSARLQVGDLVLRPTIPPKAGREIRGYGGGRFLGVSAALLAALALVLAPRRAVPWLVLAGVGVAMALGSYLVRGGAEIKLSGGLLVAMPFLYLNRALGYFAEPLNFPVRFLSVTISALAACAALAAGRSRVRGALALALSVAAAIEVGTHPLSRYPMATFAPYHYPQLNIFKEEGGGIVDFSLAARNDTEARWAAISAQMFHHQPIHGVPIDRLEVFVQDGQMFVTALPMVRYLGPSLMSGYVPPEFAGDPGRFKQDIALLRDAGFAYLLVNGVGSAQRIPAALSAMFDAILGPPVVNTPTTRLYALPEVNDGGQIEAWRVEHQKRIRAWTQEQRLDVGPQRQ